MSAYTFEEDRGFIERDDEGFVAMIEEEARCSWLIYASKYSWCSLIEEFIVMLSSRLDCSGIGVRVSTLSSFALSGSHTDLSVLRGIGIFAFAA